MTATTDHEAAAFLELADVSYRHDGAPILSDVSLTVARHEVVCLLGHSGSGKTSILRLVAGLTRPSAGRIALAGAIVADRSTFVPPQGRGLALIFQDLALFPHLTVRQNVTFGARGLTPAQQADLAADLLARLGLAGREADYPHRLSGGEQQRVALARALASRPRIVLMDEPFSSLDRHLRRQVSESALALLRERGVPALVVTHDPDEAMRIADRIVLLEGGRVLQAGTPADIHAHPQSLAAARYFSELNELAGRCRDGMVECALGRFAAAGTSDGPVTICWRLSDIEDGANDGVDVVVQSCRLLGASYSIAATIGGGGQLIIWERDAQTQPPGVGQHLRIAPRPNCQLVFPQT